jgi:hypothetical protein
VAGLRKRRETQFTDYGQHSTDKQQYPLPFIAGTLLERQKLGSPVIKGIATVTVGRNFTLEEWELYFPGEPYRKTFRIYRVRQMRTVRGELLFNRKRRILSISGLPFNCNRQLVCPGAPYLGAEPWPRAPAPLACVPRPDLLARSVHKCS